jgi:CRP-like cAMP-binding protein
MISPELLRRYPFFSELESRQLDEIAMIAEEKLFENGEKLFENGQSAEFLYFLREGIIELYYFPPNGGSTAGNKGILVDEVVPGEPFSISALIEPYVLTSSAWTQKPSSVIQIDAQALRALFEDDQKMAYVLTSHAAQAIMERLHATRIQLAVV